MRAIGTNLAAPVQQINLIVTLALAIWMLGETLTPLRILGIALILLGPGFTMREGDGERRPRRRCSRELAVVESAATAPSRDPPSASSRAMPRATPSHCCRRPAMD